MEDSDFLNYLRSLDEYFTEDVQEYPKNCILLAKYCTNNVSRIIKNENFMNFITHLQKHHPDRYFTDSARYKIDLTQSGEYDGIIRQMNYLFFVEFQVTNRVYLMVHLLNANEPFYLKYHCKTTFTVEFKQQRMLVKEALVKRKEMGTCPLEFKVSDLSMIGDIAQTEVIISIENYVLCNSCKKIKKYSDCSKRPKKYLRRQWRWLCIKCTPATTEWYCSSYRFCRTMDCLPKIFKHMHFFCINVESICYVCRKNRYPYGYKSINRHYQEHHQDITHQIGDDISIQPTPGRYCLLRSSTDTFLVMRYHLDSEELFLAIRSPWTRDILVDYNCSVTVSTYDQTETFKLCTLLYEYNDWKLSVGKWMFKKWNTNREFTVVVDIQRIPTKWRE